MKHIKLLGLMMVVLLALPAVGCDSTSSNDSSQATQTQALQTQSSAKLGMPLITNFYEKETLRNIMTACDNSKLITYSYVKNDMTGKFVFLGTSMGYGIPYGTEYTNPDYVIDRGQRAVVLPQPDPNGLYKAQGVAGTWVMLIDDKTGKAAPIYEESDVTVSPFKLRKVLCDVTSLPANY